ncbi:alpha/beta hydrolase [Nakamurella antarctica]|nr:alpha/beta hydrolase [Nakamurella antarctica]
MDATPFVDPEQYLILQAVDPAAPQTWEMSVSDARLSSDAMIEGQRPPVEVGSVRDLVIPAEHRDIPARLYRPGPDPAPLVVFFHGGGWKVGSVNLSDRPIRRLVADTGCAVISIDYRLAPEDPHPAALQDCVAATRWAAENVAELGGDGDFLAVGGDSAGANLAAGVAQMLRDEGGPTLSHQLLVYPVVARDFDTDSYLRFGEGYFLTRKAMQHFWEIYAGPTESPEYVDLYAAGPLDGLPAATVITCGLDPLLDDGEGYARALYEAGVPITYLRYNELIHGSWSMDGTSQGAYQLGVDIAGALRRAITLNRPASAEKTPTT